MSRATSASVYGSKPLDDTYVVGNRRKPQGLRSASAPDGWYAAPTTPRKPRPRRNSAVTSNKPDPAVVREMAMIKAAASFDRDDAVLIRFESGSDHSRSIHQGDWN